MPVRVALMARWLTATLLLCAAFVATACPLCMGYRPSTVHQLALLGQAVLALPTSDGGSYRVVATIKGKEPPGRRIDVAAIQRTAATVAKDKPLLLARDDTWPMWVSFGTLGTQHAGWLREV